MKKISSPFFCALSRIVGLIIGDPSKDHLRQDVDEQVARRLNGLTLMWPDNNTDSMIELVFAANGKVDENAVFVLSNYHTPNIITARSDLQYIFHNASKTHSLDALLRETLAAHNKSHPEQTKFLNGPEYHMHQAWNEFHKKGLAINLDNSSRKSDRLTSVRWSLIDGTHQSSTGHYPLST